MGFRRLRRRGWMWPSSEWSLPRPGLESVRRPRSRAWPGPALRSPPGRIGPDVRSWPGAARWQWKRPHFHENEPRRLFS